MCWRDGLLPSGCVSVAAVGAANNIVKNIREKLMKLHLVGAAVTAALSVASVSAHAGCADPRVVASFGGAHVLPRVVLPRSAVAAGDDVAAARGIVGTWQVSYTVEGQPFANAFIQWHSDHTEWENINLPVDSGNICLGSWQAVDARHVSRNHIGWLYTGGTLSGYFTETETDEVALDGQSYTGTNEQSIYDVNGVLQFQVTGTSSATRLAP
jgi:hypothetical protein